MVDKRIKRLGMVDKQIVEKIKMKTGGSNFEK